ncbi:uncharacterized protein, partial [Zea mays]|uniref:uncharacterized protein n=1 Tax=Zea mays TaxID=4577 RepID=UPI0009A96FD8
HFPISCVPLPNPEPKLPLEVVTTPSRVLILTKARIPRRLSRPCGARSLLLAELLPEGVKIQPEVVTEEESTPVPIHQVDGAI